MEELTIEVKTKECTKCHKIKRLEEFNKDTRTKDGKTYQCRECQKERASFNYHKDTNIRKRYHKKHYEENKDVRREYSVKYYDENKEAMSEKHKEYRKSKAGKKVMKKAHAKRNTAMKLNVGEPYTRWEIIQRDSKEFRDPNTNEVVTAPVCKICNEPIWELSDLHLDHVIPISEGGLDCKTNIRCTHSLCNLKRPRADVLKMRWRFIM